MIIIEQNLPTQNVGYVFDVCWIATTPIVHFALFSALRAFERHFKERRDRTFAQRLDVVAVQHTDPQDASVAHNTAHSNLARQFAFAVLVQRSRFGVGFVRWRATVKDVVGRLRARQEK